MEKDYQLRQHAEEQLKSIIGDVLWDSRADGESLMEFLEKHETDGQPLTDMQLHKFAAHWVYRLALNQGIPTKGEPEKFMLKTLADYIKDCYSAERNLYKALVEKYGKDKADAEFEKIIKKYTPQQLVDGYKENRGRKKDSGFKFTDQQAKFLRSLYDAFEQDIKDRENGRTQYPYPRQKFYRTLYKEVFRKRYPIVTAESLAILLGINRKTLSLNDGDVYEFLTDNLNKIIEDSQLFQKVMAAGQ